MATIRAATGCGDEGVRTLEANSARWHRVTPSTFPWEDEAIDYLRSGLADADPNRGWSNFEFIAGGVISEVDAFVVTRKGAFLVEIKSTPGRLVGDQQQWTFHRPDGRRSTMENPLLGANRKAKRLKSLLEHRWRKVAGPNASNRPPFIQPVVFLSADDLEVQLSADARLGVFGRDHDEDGSDRARLPGIRAGLSRLGAAEADDPHFRQLNTPTSAAVAEALELIGIKESDHTRRVGSWVLRLDTVTERPGIQDFVADHDTTRGVRRRVRIYSRLPQMSDDQAISLRQAADREFLVSERVSHPNVVRALDQLDTDLGTALVFDLDPTAERLDHWLAATEDLTLDDRLSVLRQLAETMQAVHRRKVTHRALSPGSVLVRPGRPAEGEPRWVVQVTDFSLAGRDHAGSRASTVGGSLVGTRFGLPTAAPGDVVLLADDSAALYCAPELLTDDDPDGVSLDVFSFGALAFLVISGKPPADSPHSVRQTLRDGGGLQLAAVAPGVPEELHDMVLDATRPGVPDRSTSFDDVLAWLDLVEEALTAPEPDTTAGEIAGDAATPLPEVDPLDAKAGERLGDGAVVKKRLGRGSTALALLVDRGETATPREVVYKVSLGGDADARLRDEAAVLDGLRHPGVVERLDLIELAGRPVLVEAVAGRESLADELRRNGTPGIEFLERWGTDLLEALRYLEREGRFHRDIKPDNLGVTEVGANREQHLVLFDFSLASTPSTNLRAGTPPYLEPFLEDREPKRWDLAAERYAAAITLYEMATGETPQWGDGRTHPAFTDAEVTLDPLLFDPAARAPLEGFFRVALDRDPAQRFGNAEAMLRAWQRVFEGLDTLAGRSVSDTGDDDQAEEPTRPLPEALALGDPISSVGASPKVASALDRLGVATVQQLADLAPSEVTRARRISPRVRRRIVELRAAVIHRFADELAAARVATVPAETDTGESSAVGPGEPPPRLDLDALVPLLVPPAPTRGAKGATEAGVRMILGLIPVPGAGTADWAAQTAIADALGVTRGRVGQIGPAARAGWADLAALGSVRDEIVEAIAAAGGVMAVREIEALVADRRGSGLPPDTAAQAARAVVRAAVEAEEHGDESRLVVRRRGDRVIVAANRAPDEIGSDAVEAPMAGALTAYAAALGDRADALVGDTAEVVAQDRALAQLRAVAAPTGVALTDGRLLRLAAACSQRTGSSAALELYPHDLEPVRALRLARPSLASADALTVDEVHARVRARFPDVDLPDRPQLDQDLLDAGVAVAWHDGTETFVRTDTVVGNLTSMTSVVSRQPTRATPARTTPPPGHTDPEAEEAADVEGRLLRSLEHGGFLALRVPTAQGPAARRELARFTGAPHHVVSVDLERWFLDELRAAADAKRVAWPKVIEADLAAEASDDHTYLRILTHLAAQQLEPKVAAAGERVLAWNPGVLAAYGELGLVDRLRERAGRAGDGLRTLWLVVHGSAADPKPTIDGEPVPVLGPSEWVDLTTSWLANRHGRHLPTGTDSGGPLR